MRMQVLTRQVGIGLSTLKILEISLVSAFYSMFLPGELGGGAVRWYKLSRPDNKPVEAMASITLDRLIDTIILVVLGILFWLLAAPETRHPLAGLVFITTLGAMLAILSLILSRRTAAAFLSLMEKTSTAAWASFLHDKLSKLSQSAIQYRALSGQAWMNIIVISIARILCTVTSVYLLALSLSVQISFGGAVWICSFITIVVMLPISTSESGIPPVSTPHAPGAPPQKRGNDAHRGSSTAPGAYSPKGDQAPVSNLLDSEHPEN